LLDPPTDASTRAANQFVGLLDQRPYPRAAACQLHQIRDRARIQHRVQHAAASTRARYQLVNLLNQSTDASAISCEHFIGLFDQRPNTSPAARQ
jgi:hypothetical protein